MYNTNENTITCKTTYNSIIKLLFKWVLESGHYKHLKDSERKYQKNNYIHNIKINSKIKQTKSDDPKQIETIIPDKNKENTIWNKRESWIKMYFS